MSAGDLLRRKVDSLSNDDNKDNELAKQTSEYIKEGRIIPGEITIGLLLEEIENIDKGLVLIDGFP